VAVVEAVAQDVGECAHDAVTGGVAAQVVDVLEVVQVEQQERAVAAEREVAFQFPGEGPSVEQSGQRVLVRHSDQCLLPFVPFGGVDGPFAPSSDVHHSIEVPLVQGVAADLEPPVLVLPRPDRQHQPGVRAFRGAGEQRGQRSAVALLGREFQQVSHDRVDPADPASLIGERECRVGGGQHLTG
jgi:hypothetical protein